MAGYLVSPQIQVKWGNRNLTAYSLGGVTQSIVYDVQVDCPDSGSWPTASFYWNPSGPSFQVYEECIGSGQDEDITIRFYYVNGPYILFKFQYNGANITYGKTLQIQTLLTCRNSPKSSGVRATAMKDYTNGSFKSKGVDSLVAMKDIEKAFGKPVPLLYSKASEESMKKITLASWQHKDQTYGAIVQNLAYQVGDKVTLTNISSDGQAALFGPFTWEAKQGMDSVKFPPGPGGTPESNQRYGYLLGPGIITEFQRSMEYPSQTSGNQSSPTQPGNPPNKSTTVKPSGSQNLKANADQNDAQKKAKSGSVNNPSSPSTVKGTKFTQNDVGPEKQQLLQAEESIKFSATLFMCPALVGIKPQDIIYIPSLKIGDALMEDYKVTSVSYTQSKAIISINVNATRTAGLNHPMNEVAAKKFIQKADTLKTVEDWTNYAWKERMG